MNSYFDAKRELKKIYGLGLKAIKRNDAKYINYLLFNLKQLEDSLSEKFDIDAFGTYALKKEIGRMRVFMALKLKGKGSN